VAYGKDSDQARRVINQVEDPEVANAEAPFVAAGELAAARRARLDAQGQDGGANPRSSIARQSSDGLLSPPPNDD